MSELKFQKTAGSYEFFKFENPDDQFTGQYIDTIEMEFDGKKEEVLLFAEYETGEMFVISGYHQIKRTLEAVHKIDGDEYSVEENSDQLVFRFTMIEKTKTKSGQQFTRFNCEVGLLPETDNDD